MSEILNRHRMTAFAGLVTGVSIAAHMLAAPTLAYVISTYWLVVIARDFDRRFARSA